MIVDAQTGQVLQREPASFSGSQPLTESQQARSLARITGRVVEIVPTVRQCLFRWVTKQGFIRVCYEASQPELKRCLHHRQEEHYP
jgi:hypothetical protein